MDRVTAKEKAFMQEEKEHQLLNLPTLEYKVIPQHCFVMCSRRPN